MNTRRSATRSLRSRTNTVHLTAPTQTNKAEALKTPATSRKSGYSCSICKKTFQYYATLKKHFNDADCKDINEKFYCDICNESFANGRLLHRHLRLHSTTSALFPKEQTVNDVPRQKDDMILKTGSSKLGTDESFICGICKMDFISLKLLEDHITAMHQDQFQCGECSDMFTSSGDLEQHIISKLCTAKDEYSCGDCLKHFKSGSELEQHIFSKSCLPFNSEYQCGECMEKFETMPLLEDHITSKLCKPNHIFLCGVCKCSFSGGDLLQTHMLSH